MIYLAESASQSTMYYTYIHTDKYIYIYMHTHIHIHTQHTHTHTPHALMADKCINIYNILPNIYLCAIICLLIHTCNNLSSTLPHSLPFLNYLHYLSLSLVFDFTRKRKLSYSCLFSTSQPCCLFAPIYSHFLHTEKKTETSII